MSRLVLLKTDDASPSQEGSSTTISIKRLSAEKDPFEPTKP